MFAYFVTFFTENCFFCPKMIIFDAFWNANKYVEADIIWEKPLAWSGVPKTS